MKIAEFPVDLSMPGTSAPEKRKRGRPRRTPVDIEDKPKRRRGRPSLPPIKKEIRKRVRETKASAKYRLKTKEKLQEIIDNERQLEEFVRDKQNHINYLKENIKKWVQFYHNNTHFINDYNRFYYILSLLNE
ncbi:uncharacterized protein LOC128961329 isoform X2 [Oppia nitens]|uniref:uncharacterized protein LOC128961329 isoform X2 n=1 Tax=Oppia nitens TaxID=1686743 RepID=UPI0023D989D2|nr:uncharacterized protein LOC128961329 isoform X2 [Oppia nitens]